MARTVEIVMHVAGTGMVGIGAFIAYGAIRMRVKAMQARNLPKVTGTIVTSELETRTERNGGKPIRMYGATVRYSYEVGGQIFESDQVQLGGTRDTSLSGEFQRLVARYPKGKRVPVHYDPRDPATAVIEPGETGGIFNVAMVAGGFAFVGAAMIVATFFGR
jgi:hypothetical protein